ncbi:MAG: PAS domain-containing protein [Pirellulales bacterium]|nr:PAS domain-containing protein [Pirellulales bacterium]
MSTRRSNIAELGKLLNSVVRPVYVLDEDWTIVFLNQACQEWLGSAAEGIVGQRCAYHSELKPLDTAAAGLCPPPRVFSGEISRAKVFQGGGGEKFAERPARFFPLGGESGEPFAVVAVLDAEDGPPSTEADDLSEDGPIALHEHIRRFRKEIAARLRADRLIGEGATMRLARQRVELAAACRSSVLLVGPPGSGRRRLAAAIHFGGGEKGGSPHLSEAPSGPSRQTGIAPFFTEGTLAPLDCSLLGADLPEELASIAARAAVEDSPYAPESLLLHRVDELAAEVQVRLSELLAGPMSTRRLLSTAAEPLGELARRGKFHPELAALLSTITIELPPLVERREDIPLLAQMFLEERNATGPRQIGGFSQAALDRLDAYRWPGNLDELAEAVAEAHARASGREIAPADLPERLRLAVQAADRPRRVEETIVLDEFLGRVERELIRRALARAKGNKARAARLLGVTRPRLYRRMVQLGLE